MDGKELKKEIREALDAEASKDVVVVATANDAGGAFEPLRVKMSKSKGSLFGLAISKMQDIAQKSSKWFPVASVRDSLRKFKPQVGRDVATFAVTFHNFASFVHVATGLKAVDLSTDAIVWPCVCLEDVKGDGTTSTSEAALEKTAYSAAMDRFYVAGEAPSICFNVLFVCRIKSECPVSDDDETDELFCQHPLYR